MRPITLLLPIALLVAATTDAKATPQPRLRDRNWVIAPPTTLLLDVARTLTYVTTHVQNKTAKCISGGNIFGEQTRCFKNVFSGLESDTYYLASDTAHDASISPVDGSSYPTDPTAKPKRMDRWMAKYFSRSNKKVSLPVSDSTTTLVDPTEEPRKTSKWPNKDFFRSNTKYSISSKNSDSTLNDISEKPTKKSIWKRLKFWKKAHHVEGHMTPKQKKRAFAWLRRSFRFSNSEPKKSIRVFKDLDLSQPRNVANTEDVLSFPFKDCYKKIRGIATTDKGRNRLYNILGVAHTCMNKIVKDFHQSLERLFKVTGAGVEALSMISNLVKTSDDWYEQTKSKCYTKHKGSFPA